MKTSIKLILIVSLFLISSCDTSIHYKYADKEAVLSCDLNNKDLIKEAVYAFEDYLKENYKYKDLNDILIVYSNYWPIINSELPLKTDNLNDHTKNILEKLIKVDNLYIKKDGHLVLNQDSEVIKCIAKELQDEGLKSTFNALLKTNALKPRLFVPAVQRKTSLIANDKALATYVALEQFYGLLLDMDLTISDQERFNKFRNAPTQNDHDGHNH